MTFTELLLFMLAAVGLTHIIVDGKIFEKPRELIKRYSSFLYDLTTCHQCCGTWVGFLMAVYWAVKTDQWSAWNIPIYLAFGFASSFLSTLGKSLIIYWTFGTDIVIQGNNAQAPK